MWKIKLNSLPSINGKDSSSGNEHAKNPYRKQQIIQVNEFSKEKIWSDNCEACDKNIEITKMSFESSRKKDRHFNVSSKD